LTAKTDTFLRLMAGADGKGVAVDAWRFCRDAGAWRRQGSAKLGHRLLASSAKGN
jgi:hypothetical protein